MEDGTPTLERLQDDLSPDLPSVQYLDVNDYLGELGLDVQSDFKDANHLNGSGATKLSRWLAMRLDERYGLTDHSHSDFAARWNDDLMLYDEYVALLQSEQNGATSEEYGEGLHSLAWRTLDTAVAHLVRREP
jgi:hypothetical protein